MAEIMDSKSSLGVCALPTGVKYEDAILKDLKFREMAGPEEDLLANRKMSISKKFTNMMSNCIQKFGHVEDRPAINKLVEAMVETDRIYFLIQLRMLSVDKAIEFETVCPECGEKDKVIFDLDGIKIVNPPDVNKLFSEVELPSGNKVRIKVANAKTEEMIEKAVNEKNAISLALFARVTEFNNSPPALVDIVNLSLKDRKVLREAIDKLEGEIDDKFETECPKCGHSYEGQVPLSGSDFLSV